MLAELVSNRKYDITTLLGSYESISLTNIGGSVDDHNKLHFSLLFHDSPVQCEGFREFLLAVQRQVYVLVLPWCLCNKI